MKNEVATTQENVMAVIMKISESPEISVEKIEKLLELQVKMEERESKKQFNTSLSSFQKKCPIIKNTSKVSFGTTNYSYASLDEIIYTIKPFLSENGLSYTFNLEPHESMTKLITTIFHSSGHEEKSYYIFDSMNDSQGKQNNSQRRKSALTYAQRVGICNALGVVTANIDNDAINLADNPATLNQIEEIVEVAKNTGTSNEKLLNYLNVSQLDHLSSDEAKKAISLLKKKRTIILEKQTQNNSVEF